MHPRTEALLTLRDGEPIDAALKADLLADPASAAELERLRRIKVALGELPEVDPPGDVWRRVAAELDRDAVRRIRAPLRGIAAGAIAATAAIAALVYLAAQPETQESLPSTIAADGVRGPDLGRSMLPASYVALVEESARLERLLARMPSQRPVMTARTASTIVGLEDRIALIDEQLVLGTAHDLEIPVRQALWGERVELMNALVHVRYAQAQPAIF